MEQKRDATADLALCEAATPGPWVVDDENAVIRDGNGHIVVVLEANGEPDNDSFIAKSRTALPHWIKRAVEPESRVAELEAEVRKWYDSSRQESLKGLRSEGKVITLETAIRDALYLAEADGEDLSLEPWASLKKALGE